MQCLNENMLSDEVVEKVFDEIRAISQLDHPGIIRSHSTWVERIPDRLQVMHKD